MTALKRPNYFLLIALCSALVSFAAAIRDASYFELFISAPLLTLTIWLVAKV